MASWGATADSGIWYFLPYDSDTALGGTNDGWLILPWDSDENTPNPKDPTQYAFMGHDSNLWKLVRFYLYDTTYTSQSQYGLEGCSMQDIAAVLRNEAVNNVLMNMVTINNAIGASRNYWPDIVYNFDADTKYIAPLTYQSGRGSKSDFAQFVQGSRDAHRDWLINKRFRLLDSKYAAGHFITDEKNMKLSKDEGVAANMIVSAPNKSYVQLIVNTRVVAKQSLEADVPATLDITAFALGSNDPFKLQGFSAVESIDFNTIAPYIYSDATFPSSFTNLKKVSMVCPNNDGLLAENVGGIIKSLPNIREFTMKGYPNVTGVLDLSNNIMLEKVDVDCEGLSDVILPYSHFNLTYFNVGKLNEWVPWEFWNELNEYYWKKSQNCILVGELADGYDKYCVKGRASGNGSVRTVIQITDKYFMKVLPFGSLYGGGRDWLNTGFFGDGSANASTSTYLNPQALKGIIYAKIDYARNRIAGKEYENDGWLNNMFCDCYNLEYVNTRGWVIKFDENLYVSGYASDYNMAAASNMFAMCGKLKTFDFSFLDTTPGYYRKGSSVANTLGYFAKGSNADSSWISNSQLTSIEYVKYGPNYFQSQIEKDWTTSGSYTPIPIATQATLNAQTFIDLAEDLPDISGRTFTSTKNNTLNFGQTNYNDYEKIPKTVRDKIEAKGWVLSI